MTTDVDLYLAILMTSPLSKRRGNLKWSPYPCRYKGHPLIHGPNGGRFYRTVSGAKIYVDRKYCNC